MSHGECSSCSRSSLPSTDGLFGAARTGIATSTALFASAAFVAGGRTLVASAFALATAPEIRPAVTALRAATMQFGYFVGSIAGGVALALGGYSALGATMGAFFLGAAAILARRPARGARPLLPVGSRRECEMSARFLLAAGIAALAGAAPVAAMSSAQQKRPRPSDVPRSR